jgi:hypothetical protein
MKSVQKMVSSIGKITDLESSWVYLEPLNTIVIDSLASLAFQSVGVCIVAAFLL